MTLTPTPNYYYYKLRPCDSQGLPGYLNGDYDVWSTKLSNATFVTGDRVEGSTNYFYVIAGSQNAADGDPTNGGTKYTVTRAYDNSYNPLFGCPGSPQPSPNPSRVGYFIQTGTTQQVNDWCTNNATPVDTLGGSTAYITYSLAPLTPPTTYTIYKNSPDGDGTLFYVPASGHESEYIPFVLFGGSPTKVIWKGSISPSSVIQDWTQCDTPAASPAATPTLTPTPTQTPASKYYLQLANCAFEGNSVTGWTANSYLNSECTYGEIFDSGGAFYVVINSATSPQGGSIYGNKNTSGYTLCSQTSGAWTPPPSPNPSLNFNITGGCLGGSGSGTISIGSFDGGTYSYSSVKIGNSQSNASQSSPIALNGDTSYYWSNLANATWYVLLYDSAGANVMKSVIINCVTPDPSPQPTPAASPAAPTLNSFYIWIGNAGDIGSGTACETASGGGSTDRSEVYNVGGALSEGDTVYTDALGTNTFSGGPGAGYYYSDAISYGRITNSGVFTGGGFCSF